MRDGINLKRKGFKVGKLEALKKKKKGAPGTEKGTSYPSKEQMEKECFDSVSRT